MRTAPLPFAIIGVSTLAGLGLVALVALPSAARPHQEAAANAGVYAAQAIPGERLFHQAFSAGTGSALDLRVEDADVVLLPGKDSEVEVSFYVEADDAEWGRSVFERMSVTAEERGDEIVVNARDARVQNSEWRSHHGVRITALIRVPVEMDATVHSADGDIELGDLDGSLDITTSDGDVSAGVLGGASVRIESSDGDLRIEEFAGEHARLQTSDGDVEVERGRGDFDLNTADGDVSLGLSESSGGTVETRDGDVTLILARGLGMDLDLEADDLDLDLDVELTGRVMEGRAVGTVNGGGPELRVRTRDGSLRVRSRGGR